VTAAFVYLTVCSIRNGIRLRVRRLRQVRYLLIGCGLALYVGSMLWSRPASGLVSISPDYRQYAEAAAVVIALVLLGLAWVLPNSLALAFTSSEVHFLFPAPITRRQLIGYKLSRLLLGAAGTSLFFTLIIAPPRLLPAAAFAGRTFVILAVMGLYQTGVSLYRKSVEEHVRLRTAHHFAVMATALVLTPAAAWVLARVALAPAGELVRVLPLAAALLIACWWWVLRSDASFEEAAAEAAEQVRLATGKGYMMRPRLRPNRSSPFRLAPHGPIEGAILWKNWMLISRPSRAGIFTITVLLVGLFIGVWVTADLARGRSMVGALSYFAAASVVLLGPSMLRVDLRQDLAHLAIIKTWPAGGAAVFRGELLAPLIALSLGAALPILAGSALDDKMMLDPSASAWVRASFGVSALLVASTIVLAQLIIQNGIAVTFPAWVSLAPSASIGGVERMGQMMVTMYGGILALLVASILPAGAAAAAWFLGAGWWTAPLIPSLAFSIVLAVECAAATAVFGQILDRADLQDVATVE
jgi:ABC-2 type transport system permease protein